MNTTIFKLQERIPTREWQICVFTLQKWLLSYYQVDFSVISERISIFKVSLPKVESFSNLNYLPRKPTCVNIDQGGKKGNRIVVFFFPIISYIFFFIL